jgi:hypothetical protein
VSCRQLINHDVEVQDGVDLSVQLAVPHAYGDGHEDVDADDFNEQHPHRVGERDEDDDADHLDVSDEQRHRQRLCNEDSLKIPHSDVRRSCAPRLVAICLGRLTYVCRVPCVWGAWHTQCNANGHSDADCNGHADIVTHPLANADGVRHTAAEPLSNANADANTYNLRLRDHGDGVWPDGRVSRVSCIIWRVLQRRGLLRRARHVLSRV